MMYTSQTEEGGRRTDGRTTEGGREKLSLSRQGERRGGAKAN